MRDPYAPRAARPIFRDVERELEIKHRAEVLGFAFGVVSGIAIGVVLVEPFLAWLRGL